jgi:hypothetical protein
VVTVSISAVFSPASRTLRVEAGSAGSTGRGEACVLANGSFAIVELLRHGASPLDADGSRIDMGAFTYDATYAPEPTSYCTAKLNSLGCLPDTGHQGECSATSPNPFLVRATSIVPNKTGFLFYGSGEAAAPFQGGTRCVGTPFKRTPASNSGSSGQPPCSGVLSYDFNARIRSGVDPALVPGRMVYAQYYYRDPNDPAGFGTGLSDALRFGIAP